MILRNIISIIICLWLAWGCDGNISRKSQKQNINECFVQKIECFYVVGHKENIIYTIENDSLYYNEKAILLEKGDMGIINAGAELIDSIDTIYNGACIENDAAGILYNITTSRNISRWVNCFPKEDIIDEEARGIMDILDKYFLFAYKETYHEDYPNPKNIKAANTEVEKINSLTLKKYYRQYANHGEWLIADTKSHIYREDGHNYIYTDYSDRIRKIVFDEFSEYYHLYLIGYYDINGCLIRMSINTSTLSPKYFKKMAEPTITGNISRVGKNYITDLKFIYYTDDGEQKIRDVYTEIKFPFLGEIDLSSYLSTNTLKETLNFKPSQNTSEDIIYYTFDSPKTGQYGFINTNNTSLLEEVKEDALMLESLDVGHPVDIISVECKNDMAWFKVKSQLTKTSGYILEQYIEPVEKVVMDY